MVYENLFKRIIDGLRRYSSVYYLISLILLIIFQIDIFKENVPKEIIINCVIVLVSVTLSTTLIDKIIKKRDGPVIPFIPCSMCNYGKMKQFGDNVTETKTITQLIIISFGTFSLKISI